ncbi:hypothetical protein RIF29_35728 [Crotalaria pallida]|uniref:Uncharacterized protein n=1 Tax=Crotalaria pallida TaxID=3830 RepID=A0AAN9HVB5_CROPI
MYTFLPALIGKKWFQLQIVPVKFTAEELRLIMDFKHNICNITVIAHVDHNLPLAITIALQQLKGFLGIKEFTKKTDVISVMQSVEATKVLFSVTKLFQSRDLGLRRMVYLIIKELSLSADEVSRGCYCPIRGS